MKVYSIYTICCHCSKEHTFDFEVYLIKTEKKKMLHILAEVNKPGKNIFYPIKFYEHVIKLLDEFQSLHYALLMFR